MNEIWKDIVGYEGCYQVSNLGRVKSLRRRDNLGRSIPEKIRVLNRNSDGYYQVNLSKNGIHQQIQVHVEVAKAFLGPRPGQKFEVRHLNGDNGCNTLDNLRWGTKSQNILDQVLHGTHHEARKTRCPNNHLLIDPNLAKQSGRRCRSCQRAADKIRHGKLDPSLKRLMSDAFYKELMLE